MTNEELGAWVFADGDRAAGVIADAYKGWDCEYPWKEALIAEIEYRQIADETPLKHSSMDHGSGPFDKDGNEGPNEAPRGLCTKCGGHQTSTDGGNVPCGHCGGSGFEINQGVNNE